jgi:hypothetical protein
VLAGGHPGRTSAEEITVYKSTGHAVEGRRRPPGLPARPGYRHLAGREAVSPPQLRGRLHQVAFFASIPAGVTLVVAARS